MEVKICKILKNFNYILFYFIFSTVKPNMKKIIFLSIFFFSYYFSNFKLSLRLYMVHESTKERKLLRKMIFFIFECLRKNLKENQYA